MGKGEGRRVASAGISNSLHVINTLYVLEQLGRYVAAQHCSVQSKVRQQDTLGGPLFFPSMSGHHCQTKQCIY
jgi:hypothetical protein